MRGVCLIARATRDGVCEQCGGERIDSHELSTACLVSFACSWAASASILCACVRVSNARRPSSLEAKNSFDEEESREEARSRASFDNEVCWDEKTSFPRTGLKGAEAAALVLDGAGRDCLVSQRHRYNKKSSPRDVLLDPTSRRWRGALEI